MTHSNRIGAYAGATEEDRAYMEYRGSQGDRTRDREIIEM